MQPKASNTLTLEIPSKLPIINFVWMPVGVIINSYKIISWSVVGYCIPE